MWIIHSILDRTPLIHPKLQIDFLGAWFLFCTWLPGYMCVCVWMRIIICIDLNKLKQTYGIKPRAEIGHFDIFLFIIYYYVSSLNAHVPYVYEIMNPIFWPATASSWEHMHARLVHAHACSARRISCASRNVRCGRCTRVVYIHTWFASV
jgi:hypothetical protein